MRGHLNNAETRAQVEVDDDDFTVEAYTKSGRNVTDEYTKSEFQDIVEMSALIDAGNIENRREEDSFVLGDVRFVVRRA